MSKKTIKINVDGKESKHIIKTRKPFAPKQSVVESKKVYKRKDKYNNKID